MRVVLTDARPQLEQLADLGAERCRPRLVGEVGVNPVHQVGCRLPDRALWGERFARIALDLRWDVHVWRAVDEVGGLPRVRNVETMQWARLLPRQGES